MTNEPLPNYVPLPKEKLQELLESGFELATSISTGAIPDSTSWGVITPVDNLTTGIYSSYSDSSYNVAPALPTIKPLEWSEPSEPDDFCRYNYVAAHTPFGVFRITWKGWKDDPCYSLDKTAWHDETTDYWVYENTLEEAKQRTEEEYQRRILECLAA